MCTGGRAGVRYVITKFSRMDTLPNFLTHGAPLRARESSAIKDPKCPNKIAAIHSGSQWRCKFKTSIRKISPWLTSPTGHFDGLSVIAGTFSIQNRLNINKEKLRKIRQSTTNSLHLPQNIITLNTAAENFIDNRMP